MSNKSKHIRFEREDEDEEYVPTDSEDEYTPQQKELLHKAFKRDNTPSDSEDEVYGVHSDSDSNQDIAASDVEGQDDDDDLPNVRAWGKDKRHFYSTDYVDPDYGGFQGRDASQAELEEQEAKNLQQQLMQQLDDNDFALDIFTTSKSSSITEESSKAEETVKTDISKLSKRQKLELLKKESPEFFGLVDDFKIKMTIAHDFLSPTIKLAKDGSKIKEGEALTFVRTYYDIILNYCTNIGMYLLLKVSKKNVQNHPVIKRLYQYRQLLGQLDPIFESTIKPQLEVLLAQITEQPRKQESKTLLSLLKSLQQTKDGKVKNGTAKAANDKADVEESKEDNDGTNELKETDDMEIDEPEDSRRGITYQIAKNKGLTPHRNKLQRNPRVKHRNKYRKAKIRRKGAVREVRTEMSRYGGEISGIKTTVTKSVKIKS